MNILFNTINALKEFDGILDGVSLVEMYKKDMLGFFVYLSKGDLVVKSKELDYINANLGLSLTKEDLKKVYKEENRAMMDRYKVAMATIYSSIYTKKIAKSDAVDLINILAATYKIVGTEFLACDDSVKEKEVKRLTDILKDIDITVKAYLDEIYNDDDDDDYEEASEECEESDEEESTNETITLEEALIELNSLVGLSSVKYEVNNLINYVRIRELRKERGLSVMPISYHLCFTGNPGTGKTTVARILSKIFYILGILKEDKLIEVSRSDLVGGYIGQTAIKTQEVIDSALGGVLFIDEAYSLTYQKGVGDYGIEAVDTLIKSMEDNRDNLIVIFAGYVEPMYDFINSNPGLKSRVNRFIDFEDYNHDELFEILIRMCKKNEYILDSKALEKCNSYLKELKENGDETFGNARAVRNFFEIIIANQANRLACKTNISNEDLSTITIDDIY